MSYMGDEHIVCEFLRKISPSREWKYLDEVEHYWMGELCESIREHECAENAKLRDLCSRMAVSYLPNDIRMRPEEWYERDEQIAKELQELGIEVMA
jgi:hypothetical protein